MTDHMPDLRVVPPADDQERTRALLSVDGAEREAKATLALISQARRRLAQAQTLPDIRHVMEAASVAADAAQRTRRLAEAERRAAEVVEAAAEAANDAAAVRIEAQAKAGELLREMRERGELAGRGQHRHVAGCDMSDLGVSRSDGSRWQQVAAIPPEVPEGYVEETKAARGEVSTAGLLRHARGRAGETATATQAAAAASASGPDQRSTNLLGQLSGELATLTTYPPALVRELDPAEREQFYRRARRAGSWLGDLMGELRRVVGPREVNRLQVHEAVCDLIFELRGVCGDPPVVQLEELVDQVDVADRPELLSTVRDLGTLLADLERELTRQGAQDEGDQAEPEAER